MHRLWRGGKQSGRYRASQYRCPVRMDPSCEADLDAGGAPGFWEERKLLEFSQSADPPSSRRQRGKMGTGKMGVGNACRSMPATPPAGRMLRRESRGSPLSVPSLKQAAPPASSRHLWTSSGASAAGKAANWLDCTTVRAPRSFSPLVRDRNTAALKFQ